jgi:DNA-directed RNA polymerase delta subunit
MKKKKKELGLSNINKNLVYQKTRTMSLSMIIKTSTNKQLISNIYGAESP